MNWAKGAKSVSDSELIVCHAWACVSIVYETITVVHSMLWLIAKFSKISFPHYAWNGVGHPTCLRKGYSLEVELDQMTWILLSTLLAFCLGEPPRIIWLFSNQCMCEREKNEILGGCYCHYIGVCIGIHRGVLLFLWGTLQPPQNFYH